VIEPAALMLRSERLKAASRSLGELLDRDPLVAELLDEPALPDGSGYERCIRAALASGGISALRAEKRRRLAQIAALDLSGEISLEIVGAALSALADACLDATIDHIGGSEAISVMAMGKLGGQELNYASDIDVMFVAGDDLARATEAAEKLLRLLGEFAPEGQAYRIDTDLRPEGRGGSLVRSLDAYVEYYRRWASAWEFQALIKARPAAGNGAIGRSLLDAATPLVYPSEIGSDRVAGIRAIKERVEAHAARAARKSGGAETDDVKLGPGGIRDIEFSVQLLQLVHGGSDPSVRARSTLDALAALVEGGYVAEDDGAGLAVAYNWLRTVEHRLQLWAERQVHKLPSKPLDRAQLARVMGFQDTPALAALDQFEARHQAILADVRARFEKLFYRPLIESLAEAGGPRLSSEALKERLRVLGFRDVDRATRTLTGLVGGTSRRARVFRVLTPALLRWLAKSPMPDEGLFAFLRLGEALGGRIDILGALRDNPPGLAFLARVLGSGSMLGEVLSHVPEEIASIAKGPGRTRPRTRDRLVREASASLHWRPEEQRLDGLRRFKRRMMLEIAVEDIGGDIDSVAAGQDLTHLADACLEAALEDSETGLTVIGMGKLGGRELNYASDIDVMFVHAADPLVAEREAESLMKDIGEVTPEGRAFQIDAQIRPEGKSGPLTRSIDSFNEYYGKRGRPWEHLALLKARVAAGDGELGNEFLSLTRRWAWPEHISSEALAEIRHLKARMERERIPRGTDPRRNFKLGPGGMSDVEFAIQLLQLQHAHDSEPLQTTSTLEAIEGARSADLLPAEDADELASTYRFLITLRNRLFFIAGRPVDALPPQPERLEALGIALGYREAPRQELDEDYLRVTRRARKVAEPLIYGHAP
jgi:[glutamine synthetase] adenylyltransferase / [glutamine synthetase]-adenylyl-L-tyrosine phosphorylase